MKTHRKKVRDIGILQRPKAIDILLALFETSNDNINEPVTLPHYVLLERIEGSNATMNARLADLKINNLIYDIKERKFQGRRMFKLTPLGIMTTYFLNCSYNTMQGDKVKYSERPEFVKNVEGSWWTFLKHLP